MGDEIKAPEALIWRWLLVPFLLEQRFAKSTKNGENSFGSQVYGCSGTRLIQNSSLIGQVVSTKVMKGGDSFGKVKLRRWRQSIVTELSPAEKVLPQRV